MIFIMLFIVSCDAANCPFDLTDKNKLSDDYPNEQDIGKIDNQELFFKLKNKQEDKNVLNDINIRKAIFYAIDREKIVKEFFGDNNKILNSMFNESSLYYNPVWDQYQYNPKKAKEFLKLAGYDTENPLYLTIGTTDNSPTRARIEELIKENLDQIGIKLWIYNKPSDEWYVNSVKNGDFELGIWSLHTCDTSELMNYFSSAKIPVSETNENKNCNNFYWYKNSRIDSLLNEIAQTKDDVEKKNSIDEVQKIISDEAIILPLFSRLFAVAYNSTIGNIKISTLDGNFFKGIESWSIQSEDKDKIIKITAGMGNEPNTLNPFLEENSSMNYINSMILKGLWSLDENGCYEPELIEENNMDLSEKNINENSVIIRLRNDIKWEDGTLITANDVKATIDSVTADKSVLRFRDDFDKIGGVEIVNEKEVKVDFKEHIKDWKKLFLYIFPQKDLKQNKISNLYENDIFGCGPYKIQEWIKGQYIVLVRNDNYYGDKPLPETIKIIFDSDINILVESLKNGDIDITNIPVDLKLIEELKSSKNLSVTLMEGNLWEHLAICLKPKEK
ncbi:MAG: ABC transporter substrate-binding protein [Actinomycetota bacterium]|nr:ABC transporter substrate-binding protein [Actinomycetota bacterium]